MTQITVDRVVLEQAVKALGGMLTHMGMDEDHWNKPTFDQARASAAALRAALDAKPVEVAAPVQRQPLSDDEMWALWNSQGDDAMEQTAAITFARAIERAHGIKGDV